MFSKCFLLSTISLFTLVHSISCVAENSTNQPATAKPSIRRKTSSSDVNGNVLKGDSLTPKPKTKFSRSNLEFETITDLDPVSVKYADVDVDPQIKYYFNLSGDYTDTLGVGAPYQDSPAVYGSDAIRSKRTSRTKRTTDFDNFSEVSESYQENSAPEQPLRESPIKIGRTGSETNGNKRNSKKSKNTAHVESRLKDETKDTTAQSEFIPPSKEDEFNDNWVSFDGETSTLVTSSIKESGKTLNDYSPDDEPETIDELEYSEGGDKVYESNQLSGEPLILVIFKIISKSLGEMFSALKDVLQKPI